jgi:hypothetical protein
LSRFEVGQQYLVGTSLANYMLAAGSAVPVADDSPAKLTPLEDRLVGEIRNLARAAADAVVTATEQPRRRRPRTALPKTDDPGTT